MDDDEKKYVMDFLAIPIFDQMPLFYLEEEDSPVFNDYDFTDNEKLVIYLNKVSHYMNLVLRNRNIDKLVKSIVTAYYEDDCSYKEAIESDDMCALATACYYSQKDFSNKDKYYTVIRPLIKTMKKN
jgi:hypothetical protein